MRNLIRSASGFGVGALAAVAFGLVAPPVPAASTTLNNWHVHDCTSGCPYYDSSGVWHQPVAFFPRILGESLGQYLADPVACPNATDKLFLPGEISPNQPLRAGVCMNSSTVIHLRSNNPGDPAPEGWTFLGTSVVNGTVYAHYYLLTPNS